MVTKRQKNSAPPEEERKALFYVSGHGYGHAVRTRHVIRALLAQDAAVEVIVRTPANGEVFADLGERVHVNIAPIDFRVEETDGRLKIDEDATVRGLESFFEDYDVLVKTEAEFAEGNGVSLIVADIPFLTGDVANATGIPSIGISNFTWDWILEPLLKTHAAGPVYLRRMRASYAKMTHFLRLPFGHFMTGTFPGNTRIINVPAVVCAETSGKEALRIRIESELGISIGGFEHVVFVVMGVGKEPQARLVPLGRAFPKALFFCHGEESLLFSKNAARLGSRFTYDELLNVCSALVCKLGYCTVANGIAERKRLLFPPREGFREDTHLVEASEYMVMEPMSRAEFDSPDWEAALTRLFDHRLARPPMGTSGAQVCASEICRELAGT